MPVDKSIHGHGASGQIAFAAASRPPCSTNGHSFDPGLNSFMPFDGLLVTLAAALIVEAVAGYPDALYRGIGHPVTWIGRLIANLDAILNRPDRPTSTGRLIGVAATFVIVGIPAAAAWLIQSLLLTWPYGWVVVAGLASTLIASRSLYTHVADVARALTNNGLAGGRLAVSRIVGRDVTVLDEAGVSRAAIESLAENASDGVVAPVFWFAVLGLPGVVAYKAINTADSMVGHLNERYRDFGWASARLDDVVNPPASRLTALLFIAAAALDRRASARDAATAVWRDARHHKSPNAGWPESAMAGALGLRLAGPRIYDGQRVNGAWMGDGRADATVDDIHRALRLAWIAWWLMFASVLLLAGVMSMLI